MIKITKHLSEKQRVVGSSPTLSALKNKKEFVVFKITKDDIKTRFACLPITEDQCDKCTKIAEAGKKLANLVNKLCPDSREKSLSITKIEEAMMWANASISRNE